MTEEVIVCPKVRAKVKNDLALFNLEGAAMRTLKARRYGKSSPNKFEAQRSGFKFERRSNEAIWSFHRRQDAAGGNGMSGVCFDEMGV